MAILYTTPLLIAARTSVNSCSVLTAYPFLLAIMFQLTLKVQFGKAKNRHSGISKKDATGTES
jgi:hypothetical protein